VCPLFAILFVLLFLSEENTTGGFLSTSPWLSSWVLGQPRGDKATELARRVFALPRKVGNRRKLWGFGRGVQYTIDKNGKAMSARGITMSEKVELKSFTPEAAKVVAEGLDTEKDKVSILSITPFMTRLACSLKIDRIR